MHFSRPAALSLVVLGAAAIPLDVSLQHKRDLPPDFDLCIQARNCEVYEDHEGEWAYRFVAGKEPGSEWYNDNVNMTGKVGPRQEEHNLISKRQSPCSTADGEICTQIHVRESRTVFGTIKPRDASDT